MERQRIIISLHISHPTRDLSTVCRTLGLIPKHIWKNGDELPKGNRLGAMRVGSFCSVDLGPASRTPLGKQINGIIKPLQPHRGIFRSIFASGGKTSLFVGWFLDEHTGDTLDPKILLEMAKMRIALELNIYLPDDPQIDSGWAVALSRR
jgi:hypothetical protein